MANLVPPPLREDPFQADKFDGQRSEYSDQLWVSQDRALEARDRQIEENVRMLAGQQWLVWSDALHRFIDIRAVLTPDERRYKQRPVVNKLSYWFSLTHSRMTENPPIISFEAQTEDSIDADLAAAMDTLSKTLWEDLGMNQLRQKLEAWRIVGGSAVLYHQIDPNKGDPYDYYGPATVEMLNPVTGQMEAFLVTDEQGQVRDDIPYAPDEEGNFVPQVQVNPETGQPEVSGEAWREFEGGFVASAHSPLEWRGEWGNDVPWHMKAWHLRRTYLTPDKVKETWGIEVQGDPNITITNTGQLERILRGSGNFGAAKENVLWMGDHEAHGDPMGLVRVDELWVRPGAHGTPMQTDESPGGRLLITLRGLGGPIVVRDGVRPAWYRYTSPSRRFDFIDMPGSPHARTPMEYLNMIQRLYNRTWAQILEHTNLVANPIMVTDSQANVPDITNRPGQRISVTRRPGVPAVEFVAPPRLSDDVYKQLQLLANEFNEMGNIFGASGAVPQTDDNTGALIRELRFNSDRYLGAPLRQGAEEFAKFWEDILESVKVTWTREKVISWMGEDSVLRTITVTPEMFKGKINVKPDLESMLPESRQERQERSTMLWQSGFFGNPEDPMARTRFAELARFPHMGRAYMPGGSNWETARYVMGQIAQGKDPNECRIYSWYDLTVWLQAASDFMSTPQYLRLDERIQTGLAIFRGRLIEAAQRQVFDDQLRAVSLGAKVRAAGVMANLAVGAPQMEAAAAQELAGPGGEEGPTPTEPPPVNDVGPVNAALVGAPETGG